MPQLTIRQRFISVTYSLRIFVMPDDVYLHMVTHLMLEYETYQNAGRCTT